MTLADTNRVALRFVEESSYAVTPSAALQTLRITGETLNFAISNIESNEINSDRMTSDLIQVDASSAGNVNFELSYGNLDALEEGALWSDWVETPNKDSVAANHTGDKFVVASGGTAFKQYMLIQASGYTNGANNGIHVVGASSTGTDVPTGSTLVTESGAAGKNIKVVGARIASDIAAVTSGGNRLTSSTLDFTTLGLVVGQWIKIDGFAASSGVNNQWARVTSIAANALYLDNLNSSFTAESAGALTISLYFGDYLRNGTTKKSYTFEREAADVGKFFSFKGALVNTLSMNLQTGEIFTGSIGLMASKNTAVDTVTVGTGTALAATTADVMNAVSDAVVINEGGSSFGIIRSMSITVNNQDRQKKAIGSLGAIDIGGGKLQVTGNFEIYFQDTTFYAKYLAGTATSFAIVLKKNGQGRVITIPEVKIEAANVNAAQGNSDMVVQGSYKAKKNATTNCMIQFDRLPYFT